MMAADHGKCSRRSFLRIGWTLGAGLILPAGLHGCEQDAARASAPDETFVEPATLASVNGELDVTLTIAYVQLPLNGKMIRVRSLSNSIPAPTLRIGARSEEH